MNLVVALLLAALGLALLAMAASALFTLFAARKVEALLPPGGRFIEVPGARLHVMDVGQGRAILLIHGLGGQLAHYTYGIVARLSGRFRVVAVDRPGCGWSRRGRGAGADLTTQAAAMAALIERLGLERPLVVGHSLGGAVALALALEHPDKVSALALLAPLSHLPDAFPPVFKGLGIASPALRQLAAWTLALPRAVFHRRATLAQVFGPDEAPPDFGTRGGALLGLRPAAFLAACADLQALPARLPDQEKRYHRLRMPVGVLFGTEDRILDWRANGRALVDKLSDGRLALIAGGHMLPITRPDTCADFIKDMAAASGLTLTAAERTGSR